MNSSRKLRYLLGAAAILALPAAANAALISGQLDITGNIVRANSIFTPTGQVDFDPEMGTANIASGDFDAFVTTVLEGGAATIFTLQDIDFTAPSWIYQGGGFTFTATDFFDFDNDFTGGRGFSANGTITGNGFDPTPGVFAFSTQQSNPTQVNVSFSSTTSADGVIPLPAALPLLIGGMGVFAMVASRRKPA